MCILVWHVTAKQQFFHKPNFELGGVYRNNQITQPYLSASGLWVLYFHLDMTNHRNMFQFSCGLLVGAPYDLTCVRKYFGPELRKHIHAFRDQKNVCILRL